MLWQLSCAAGATAQPALRWSMLLLGSMSHALMTKLPMTAVNYTNMYNDWFWWLEDTMGWNGSLGLRTPSHWVMHYVIENGMDATQCWWSLRAMNGCGWMQMPLTIPCKKQSCSNRPFPPVATREFRNHLFWKMFVSVKIHSTTRNQVISYNNRGGESQS